MNKTKGFTKYKKMRYMPGLDGLRAIAVLGIIIYHLNKQWLTGGFLGVDTFFVISGYLITSLLLKEYDDTGIIKLKKLLDTSFKTFITSSHSFINGCRDSNLIIKIR